MEKNIVTGLSKEALLFLEQNDDLIAEAYKYSQVNLSIAEIDNGDRIVVIMEVGEDTQARQLRAAEPYALLMRDKLLDCQGVAPDDIVFTVMENLSDAEEKRKESYSTLAYKLNEQIETWLNEYFLYREEVENLYPKYKIEFENNLLFCPDIPGLKNKRHGLILPFIILRLFAFSTDEATEIIKKALEDIQKRKKPFQKNEPISKIKMIDKLKTWRHSKKHKVVKAIVDRVRGNVSHSPH